MNKILRYAVRPKPTLRGWYVWAVVTSEKGAQYPETWASKPTMECTTKRLAKMMAAKMNEEITFESA